MPAENNDSYYFGSGNRVVTLSMESSWAGCCFWITYGDKTLESLVNTESRQRAEEAKQRAVKFEKLENKKAKDSLKDSL